MKHAMDRHRCDRIVVGFTTTCAICSYHYYSCEFKPCSWRVVLETTLYGKVCQWLATGRCFSPVSSTNKTRRHDITKILLKVALNIINQLHETYVHYFSFNSIVLSFNLYLNPPPPPRFLLRWEDSLNSDSQQNEQSPPTLNH